MACGLSAWIYGWPYHSRWANFQRVEQERRSAYRYLAVGLGLAILFAALLLLWLAAPRKRVTADFGLSFTPPRSGHMANFYSKHFFVAMVTNATPGTVGLEDPVVEWDDNGTIITAPRVFTFRVPSSVVEWDDNGTIITGLANLWGSTNGLCSLGSSEVMPLPFEIPTNSTKFRISFEYWREAGPFQKLLSPVSSKLFPRNISRPLPQRLFRDGWFDGRLHLTYIGGWEANR